MWAGVSNSGLIPLVEIARDLAAGRLSAKNGVGFLDPREPLRSFLAKNCRSQMVRARHPRPTKGGHGVAGKECFDRSRPL